MVLHLSLENENKTAKESRKKIRRPGPTLLSMWRGDIGKPTHSQYRRNYIVVEDYIMYMDLIYDGTPEQKNRISFMMCDVKGEGKVSYGDYRHFWIKFLEMHGELLQMKTIYNEDTEFITKDYFEKIVNAKGPPKRDLAADGGEYFTHEDFDQAKEDHPEIFEWIEFPDKYINEMMEQNAQKDRRKMVSFDDYQGYHDRVMVTFQSIVDVIKAEFGVNDEEGAFSVFGDQKEASAGRGTAKQVGGLALSTAAKVAGWAYRHSSESSRLAGTLFRQSRALAGSSVTEKRDANALARSSQLLDGARRTGATGESLDGEGAEADELRQREDDEFQLLTDQREKGKASRLA